MQQTRVIYQYNNNCNRNISTVADYIDSFNPRKLYDCIFRFHSLFIMIKYSFWHESLCLQTIHLCHVLLRWFFNNSQIAFLSNTFIFPRCLSITKNKPFKIVPDNANSKRNWPDNVWRICSSKANNYWPHHLDQVFNDRCWCNCASDKSNLSTTTTTVMSTSKLTRSQQNICTACISLCASSS